MERYQLSGRHNDKPFFKQANATQYLYYNDNDFWVQNRIIDPDLARIYNSVKNLALPVNSSAVWKYYAHKTTKKFEQDSTLQIKKGFFLKIRCLFLQLFRKCEKFLDPLLFYIATILLLNTVL